MTISEPPFLASLNVGYPQVVIVDKGDDVGVSRADLGVHTGPWALGLDLHWLYRSRLLKPTDAILAKSKEKKDACMQRKRIFFNSESFMISWEGTLSTVRCTLLHQEANWWQTQTNVTLINKSIQLTIFSINPKSKVKNVFFVITDFSISFLQPNVCVKTCSADKCCISWCF